MRTNPANWKLGMVYVCHDDPRVVVRQRMPFGWTWNFANPWVIPAIPLTVMIAVGPALLVWLAGVRSILALAALLGVGLAIVIALASRLSKDPELR